MILWIITKDQNRKLLLRYPQVVGTVKGDDWNLQWSAASLSTHSGSWNLSFSIIKWKHWISLWCPFCPHPHPHPGSRQAAKAAKDVPRSINLPFQQWVVRVEELLLGYTVSNWGIKMYLYILRSSWRLLHCRAFWMTWTQQLGVHDSFQR